MKVYFDKGLINQEYVSFLSPILGEPCFDIWWEDKGQIKDWSCLGKKYLFESSMQGCDYFVYPKYFSLELSKELKKYAELATKCGKRTVVFDYGEIDDYIDISDDIIWFKRSTKIENPENEFCLPPFPSDVYPEVKGIGKTYDDTISVGFCGYSKFLDVKSFLKYIISLIIGTIFSMKIVKYILLKIGNTRLYQMSINAGKGNYYRGKVIKSLNKMKKYKFRFIQRRHALTLKNSKSFRKEYLLNIVSTTFPLSVRGFGNYSVRHYEILSVGKIPLYIDTGAKLPFQDEINYNDLFLVVPFFDVKNTEKYIDKYLEKNQANIKEIEQNVRKLYLNYFTMSNYYLKVIEKLCK